MAKILGLAGSNSSTSINFKLVEYTADLLEDQEVHLLDMALIPFPMYSEDMERDQGFPPLLVRFKEDIRATDGIIISVNEHNGNPSAYTKNLLDWLSRLDLKFLKNKPIFLMSTSPGSRGAISSRTVIEKMFPKFGGEIVSTFSLPSFEKNFTVGTGILDEALAEEHQQALKKFLKVLDAKMQEISKASKLN